MQKKILGINPGARYIGYAHFNNSELRDWGIKAVKGKWSAEKSQKIGRILLELLAQYQPDVVAIKKLLPSRSSVNLAGIVNRFRELCRERNIYVLEFPINYLEKVVLTGKMNKKELAQAMAELYPALHAEAQKEKANKNSYHIRMFEAVALGHVGFTQTDN